MVLQSSSGFSSLDSRLCLGTLREAGLGTSHEDTAMETLAGSLPVPGASPCLSLSMLAHAPLSKGDVRANIFFALAFAFPFDLPFGFTSDVCWDNGSLTADDTLGRAVAWIAGVSAASFASAASAV